MQPAEQNLVVVEGDTLDMTITLTDADTGDPIDLTGGTPKMQVKETYAGAAVLDITTSGGGISVPDPSAGVVIISKAIPLEAGQYVYDFQIATGSVIKTYFRGRFKVLEGVTT